MCIHKVKKEKNQFSVSGHCARRPRPGVSIFNFLSFCLAMKRCPIAAKFAGSIGILPCCVFPIEMWTFSRFVRPLLATILSIWEIWSRRIWAIPPGWDTICEGVNCYICKCTIYYPWLWLLINIVVISYWRWRDWFYSILKNNCECVPIIMYHVFPCWQKKMAL